MTESSRVPTPKGQTKKKGVFGGGGDFGNHPRKEKAKSPAEHQYQSFEALSPEGTRSRNELSPRESPRVLKAERTELFARSP